MPAYPAEFPVPVLSALYASTAGTAARTLALAADWFARSLNERYEGIAIASRMPRMMMTTRSSMRVKPLSSPASRFDNLSRIALLLLPDDVTPARNSAEGPAPPSIQLSSAEAYGHAPVTMSAPGPAFFQVAGPTVLWTQ